MKAPFVIRAAEWAWAWAHESGRYVVPETFRVNLGDKILVVDAGYLFDGASIAPNGPHNEVMKAAAAHDMLYARGEWDDGTPCERIEADTVLFRLMREAKIATAICWLYYYAVRRIGWIPWNRYRRMEAREECTVFFLSPNDFEFNGWEMKDAKRLLPGG